MTAPIGPGDWVERWRPFNGSQATVVGRIYRVLEIGPSGPCCACNECCVGIRLVGVKPLYPDGWLSSCCFRPIYRPREDLIATLLEPLPDTVLPVEA